MGKMKSEKTMKEEDEEKMELGGGWLAFLASGVGVRLRKYERGMVGDRDLSLAPHGRV